MQQSVTIAPGDGARVLVNGQTINSETALTHNDRVRARSGLVVARCLSLCASRCCGGESRDGSVWAQVMLGAYQAFRFVDPRRRDPKASEEEEIRSEIRRLTD